MGDTSPVGLRTVALWTGPQLLPDGLTITLAIHRGEKLLPLEVPLTVAQAVALFEELETILRRIGRIFPTLADDHAS